VNVVVLRGTLSRPPTVRALPSGDRLATYDVSSERADGGIDSAPVVWFDPPETAEGYQAGEEVVVVGRVRRRFYRSAGVTHSRTEVVAEQVLRSRQARRVERLLARTADELRG
jgi:single-strand DNA-binding protein